MTNPAHWSPAGEGLQLEGSLRRSTRRSVKPLDWWRNEKAVYERKFKSASLPAHSLLFSKRVGSRRESSLFWHDTCLICTSCMSCLGL